MNVEMEPASASGASVSNPMGDACVLAINILPLRLNPGVRWLPRARANSNSHERDIHVQPLGI